MIKKILFLFGLCALLMISCGEKNNPDDLVQSVILQADKASITADGKDAVTFTVKTQKGIDVTSEATIYVNRGAISGNTFTTTKAGTFTAYATYKGKDSDEVTITASEQVVEAALVITADKTSILANDKDQIIFTVKRKEGGEVVTNKCEFYVDGVRSKTAYRFKTKVPGEHKVVAKMKSGESSDEFVFQANEERDILLETDKTLLYLDGKDKATFKVTDKDGSDISTKAKYYVGSEALTDNTFLPKATGTFTIRAEYEGNVSNNITVKVRQPIQYRIEIVPDKKAFTNDGVDMVVLKAYNRLENDQELTSDMKFFVNGAAIEGNIVKSTTVGELQITGKYNDIDAVATKVTVQTDFVPTPRVFAEQFTGTWCPFCPRLIDVIDKAALNPQVVASALHAGNDPFATPDATTIGNALGVQGYPSIVVNRVKNTLFSDGTVASITKHIPATVNVGVVLETKIVGSSVECKAIFKTTEDLNNVKWIAILTENGLIADQKNQAFPERGNPIKDMEHKHVYRLSHPSVWGQTISFTKGTPVTKEFKLELKAGWKAQNCNVIILVSKQDDTVITAQEAKAGSARGY